MDARKLEYAIQDARRFADRAEEMLDMATELDEALRETVTLSDDQVKTLRRLSLDVTHAMKDLRDSCEARVEVTES